MLAFLDIDGVLNSREHFHFRGTEDGIKRRAQLLLDGQPLVNTNYVVGLTDDDIIKIKDILE